MATISIDGKDYEIQNAVADIIESQRLCIVQLETQTEGLQALVRDYAGQIKQLKAENTRMKQRLESIECGECAKNIYDCNCLDIIALDEQV